LPKAEVALLGWLVVEELDMKYVMRYSRVWRATPALKV